MARYDDNQADFSDIVPYTISTMKTSNCFLKLSGVLNYFFIQSVLGKIVSLA